jgi:ribosome-binding factor A
VPELRFDYDTGHDAVRRVEELLREVRAEAADQNGDD